MNPYKFIGILQQQCQLFRRQTPNDNFCMGSKKEPDAFCFMVFIRSFHGNNKAIASFATHQKTIPCVCEICRETRVLGVSIGFLQVF